MPTYWDSDGNKIGFREGLKFQAKDPKGFAEAQAARRLARQQGMTADEDASRGSAKVADRSFRLNSKVAVHGDEIIHGRDKHPLAGARATVDTAGAIDKRVTATRLLTTGVFAFGLRKKKDERELFLLIEGDGFGFVVDLDPKKQKEAREFAAKLNAATARTAVPDPGSPPPGATRTTSGPSIPDQIRQLGELRDQGLLTSEEFEAKKSELLERF